MQVVLIVFFVLLQVFKFSLITMNAQCVCLKIYAQCTTVFVNLPPSPLSLDSPIFCARWCFLPFHNCGHHSFFLAFAAASILVSMALLSLAIIIAPRPSMLVLSVGTTLSITFCSIPRPASVYTHPAKNPSLSG